MLSVSPEFLFVVFRPNRFKWMNLVIREGLRHDGLKWRLWESILKGGGSIPTKLRVGVASEFCLPQVAGQAEDHGI